MITFTIITPTIQRQSLIKCCRSVEAQTLKNQWQHVIAVDSDKYDDELMEQLQHPQREIFLCGQRFGHYGNHPRWMAWEKATGDYLIYLDCDNYLAHDKALEDIANSLESANYPQWAIFPIWRHSGLFFCDPPGLCMTDTLNLVVKREIGRWLDIEAREADGHLVEALKAKYPHVMFPNVSIIGVMERSSNGE